MISKFSMSIAMRTVLTRFVRLGYFGLGRLLTSPTLLVHFFSFSIHALESQPPHAPARSAIRSTLASSNMLPSRASTTSSILSSSSSLTPPTLSSSWISTASALLLYHLPGLMPPKWCRPVTPDFEEKDGWNTFNLLDKVFAYKEAARGESRTGTYPLLCIGFVCIIDRRCDSRTRYSFLKSRRYTRYRPFWTSK